MLAALTRCERFARAGAERSRRRRRAHARRAGSSRAANAARRSCRAAARRSRSLASRGARRTARYRSMPVDCRRRRRHRLLTLECTSPRLRPLARNSLISLRFASRAGPARDAARDSQGHENQRDPQQVHRLLRLEGAHARALELARPRQRSDAALHQRGHEPVQGRLPRHGEAAVQPRASPRRSACAPAASTTTSRTSATPRATTRSSRCSATSASATTSSATRSASRGSSSRRSYGLPTDKLWTTVYADRRRGLRPLDQGHRRADGALHPHRRQAGRAQVRERQLLADGRHRPVRPVLARSSTTTAPASPAARPARPTQDGDRYIEIWNLVFMQFNRDEAGTLHPLPKPSVDTGMGLERLTAVLQHVHSNYEIDLFQALIKAAARETHTKDLESPSLRVIADHIRACAFLVCDGVIPEQRGPRLRAAPHRAPRHAPRLQARARSSRSSTSWCADLVRGDGRGLSGARAARRSA